MDAVLYDDWFGVDGGYPQTFLSMSEPVLAQLLAESPQTLVTSLEGGL